MCVLVVAALFSDVNVDCEVVFSDPDCEIVEPQNLSLSSTREASVVLERETTEDVNPPRTAPERVLVDKMEQYLEKSEGVQVHRPGALYAWTRRCGHLYQVVRCRCER